MAIWEGTVASTPRSCASGWISEVIGTREEVLACLRLQSAVRTREWRRRSAAAARVIQQRHRAAHEDSLSRRTTHQGQGAREPLRRAKSSGA